MVRLIPMLALCVAPAFAQTDDAAAERARLANQRIQAEMERREREVQERAEVASREPAQRAEEVEPQQARPVEQVSEAPPPDRPPVPPAAKESEDLSEALEQLRTLGQLRDAGYVTDDEFARIKKKILDEQF